MTKKSRNTSITNTSFHHKFTSPSTAHNQPRIPLPSSSTMSSTAAKTTAAAATQKGGYKSASLPSETPEHVAHSCPTEQEKNPIISETGIELKQLKNWSVNNRTKFWKPPLFKPLVRPNCRGTLLSPARARVTLPRGGGLSKRWIHRAARWKRRTGRRPGGASRRPRRAAVSAAQSAPHMADTKGLAAGMR